jgi:hypothetical protein
MYAAQKLSSMDVLDEITQFVDSHKNEIKAVGSALFVVGVLLMFIPGMLGFGLALIVAGVAAIFVTEVPEWSIDGMKAAFDSVKGPIADLLAVSGALLIVFGMILCFTGVGMGVGLAMILAGAAAEYGAIKLDPDSKWADLLTIGPGPIFTGEDPALEWYKQSPYSNMNPGLGALYGSGILAPTPQSVFGTSAVSGSVSSTTVVLEVDGEEFARAMQPAYNRFEQRYGVTYVT